MHLPNISFFDLCIIAAIVYVIDQIMSFALLVIKWLYRRYIYKIYGEPMTGESYRPTRPDDEEKVTFEIVPILELADRLTELEGESIAVYTQVVAFNANLAIVRVVRCIPYTPEQ